MSSRPPEPGEPVSPVQSVILALFKYNFNLIRTSRAAGRARITLDFDSRARVFRHTRPRVGVPSRVFTLPTSRSRPSLAQLPQTWACRLARAGGLHTQTGSDQHTTLRLRDLRVRSSRHSPATLSLPRTCAVTLIVRFRLSLSLAPHPPARTQPNSNVLCPLLRTSNMARRTQASSREGDASRTALSRAHTAPSVTPQHTKRERRPCGCASQVVRQFVPAMSNVRGAQPQERP